MLENGAEIGSKNIYKDKRGAEGGKRKTQMKDNTMNMNL